MKPIRVLHVLGALLPGGIEMWLIKVLRNVDRDQFKIDIVISSPVGPSPIATEAESLGSKIFVCRKQSRPLRYALNLARTIRKEGPYDIVHGHLHQMNAAVCLGARLANVPARIVHTHTLLPETGSVRHKICRLAMRKLANGALGCSDAAGGALLGLDWKESLNGRHCYYGIDLEPFRVKQNRAEMRAAFGIPAHATVIGHLGRFVPEKNHSFWLEIAESYARLDPSAHFLLLGDGPLRLEMSARAAASPLAGRFHLPGSRPDVLELLGAMDVFLFPSYIEGLPAALIEAQAAGLPCVFSDFIVPEVDVCPSILSRMSLKKPPEDWARALQQLLARTTQETRASAFQAVESSEFNLTRSVAKLERYYVELCGRAAFR